MLKSAVLCDFLWHAMCGFSSGCYSESTDTRTPNFPPRVIPKINNTDVQNEPKVNYYFNITMIFNTYGPLPGTTASPTVPTTPTTTSPTAPPTKSPTTYPGLISPRPGNVVTNGVYILHSEKRSWGDARQICISEGGDLVVVKSFEEEMLVQKMLGRLENFHAWIGYHNQCGQGCWISVFNEPLSKTGWQHWWSDTMDRNSGNQCARYYLLGPTVGEIGALNCDETESFICKMTII